MFLGEYEHSLDQKGRLAIPVKFRSALSDGAIVARGLDGCLTLYPKREWQVLAEKIAALPLTDSNARMFARFILSGASDVEADKQGRIILPAYLRQYADLDATVVVAGLYNRIEIWNHKTWKALSDARAHDSGSIADQLSNLGI